MANPRARLVDLLAEITDEEADTLLELLAELFASQNTNPALDAVNAEVVTMPSVANTTRATK